MEQIIRGYRMERKIKIKHNNEMINKNYNIVHDDDKFVECKTKVRCF